LRYLRVRRGSTLLVNAYRLLVEIPPFSKSNVRLLSESRVFSSGSCVFSCKYSGVRLFPFFRRLPVSSAMRAADPS